MNAASAIAIVVGVVVLGALAAFVRQRLISDGSSNTPTSADFETPGEIKAGAHVDDVSTALVAADGIVLVPLPNAQGQALLLGSDEALAVFDRSGLTTRDPGQTRGPLPQLVRQIIGAGGGEATRRAQTGIDTSRIVALSPETVEHLRTGEPVYDKAGEMLGLVRGDHGKLKHVMRLDRKGAQAVVASNAATLALTAALSQQLASIEKQLEHISATLRQFVKDYDRRRIANIAGVNRSLMKSAENIRRRGRITEADWDVIASLSESVETNSIEAAAKLDELSRSVAPGLDRGERHELLKDLVHKESLAYWLSALAESDLALTRWDLLHLYWEQSQDPDSAAELAEHVRAAFEARQANRHRIGLVLVELSDPRSRTRLDPLRQRARHRLRRHHDVVASLIEAHGDAFASPADNPYAVQQLAPPTE